MLKKKHPERSLNDRADRARLCRPPAKVEIIKQNINHQKQKNYEKTIINFKCVFNGAQSLRGR